MCLEFSKPSTAALKKQFPESGVITAYKVYEASICRGELVLKSIHNDFWVSEPGDVVSNRQDRQVGKDPHDYHGYRCPWEINRGIHVYLSKDSTYGAKIDNRVLVPVKCRKEDLVGRNKVKSQWATPTAVFMKVSISKKTWNALERRVKAREEKKKAKAALPKRKAKK